MTRSRRAPGDATRARLLGCVLALVGLLAGAAACADVGGGDAAAGHGLVLRADGPRTDVLDGLRAGGPQADAPPGDGLRAGADAPPPTDCSAAHTPGAPDTPAGDCPGSPERAPAVPLFGPGPCPAPAGPAYAAAPAATADGGVGPPAPSAVGSPCLHELQVQRT